ncbi:MAG TPA: hypothetical protein VGO86_10530 [Candidatus Dormibacteraeota bacterium]
MSPVHSPSGLGAFARRHGFMPVSDAGFVALPALDQAELEDEESRVRELSWELPAAAWRPIECAGTPLAPPQRFIDGSLVSRTVGVVRVDGARRPLVLASTGALELCLDGRRLRRPAEACVLRSVLCLIANGIPPDELAELAEGCAALGLELLAAESKDVTADFDVLRRRSFDLAKLAMERAERDLLLRLPDVPALVDGLLERRLVAGPMPALGMVKRQMRQYLPSSHLALLYDLAPGQRTPAFVLETEHARVVSWYLRLSTTEMAGPSYGLVRLTMPLEYVTHLSAPAVEISALSAFVRGLRHREGSYARVGVSLEPIVRVEDELHALMPSIEELSARLARVLA